jgi:hypothetical protein
MTERRSCYNMGQKTNQKQKRLTKMEYIDVFDNYLQKLFANRATLRDIGRYLVEDGIHPKQAEKMLGELEKTYRDKIEDVLDEKIWAILEVLRMPVKWGIDKEDNIITLYPHPVLDDTNKVIAVQYKPSRAYLFPDELFDRYCALLDEIEAVDEAFKKKQSKSRYVKKGDK